MMPSRPRLLFLAHLLPWPLTGGGQIKSCHALRLLAERFDVTLIAFVRRPEEAGGVDALRPLCAGGIRTVPLPRGRWRDALAAARALASGRSVLVVRDFVPAMRDAVHQALADGGWTAVHADHLAMMAFVPPAPGVPVVLDQHNVEHRIPAQMADFAPPVLRPLWRREARTLRAFEADACRRVDRVLAVSEDDARAFRDLLGPDAADKVRVTPIGVDTDYFVPSPIPAATRTILTVGTLYWPPNVDGVRWFARDVLPRVRARVPGAPFTIAGARPARAVRALAREPGVTVTGTVPDVRPLMAACSVFVAPVRAGSGVRVKILNALAMGLPIVSTTLGAEGIDGIADGENVLLADTPAAFADAVARLLADPALAASLGRAARNLAETRYAWPLVARALLSVYDELAPGAKPLSSCAPVSPPPSEERAYIGGGDGGEGQRGRPTAGQAGGEGQKAGGEGTYTGAGSVSGPPALRAGGTGDTVGSETAP